MALKILKKSKDALDLMLFVNLKRINWQQLNFVLKSCYIFRNQIFNQYK